MYLKRLYDHSEGLPRVRGVRVIHAEARQKFSTRLMRQAVAEGWMVIGNGRIVVRAEPHDLTYRIIRGPGYYCCFCGEELPGAHEAQAHVAGHLGVPRSPSLLRRLFGEGETRSVADPANPSGYRRDNFYDCVLER